MAQTSRSWPVPAQPDTLVNCQARPHHIAPECERHLPLARLVVVARGDRDGEFEARHDVEALAAITERADPMLHALPRLGRDQQLAQIPVPAVAGTLIDRHHRPERRLEPGGRHHRLAVPLAALDDELVDTREVAGREPQSRCRGWRAVLAPDPVERRDPEGREQRRASVVRQRRANAAGDEPT
jgi:hypothetical protein